MIDTGIKLNNYYDRVYYSSYNNNPRSALVRLTVVLFTLTGVLSRLAKVLIKLTGVQPF